MATKSKLLEVFRDDAVELFQALDFKTAGKWNRKKMRGQLKGLGEILEDGFVIGDEGLDKLLSTILAAIENGDDIDVTMEKPAVPKDVEEVEDGSEAEAEEVEDDEEDEDEDDEEVEEESVPVKAKKEKKEKKARADEKKDKFGNKEGTQASSINEAVVAVSAKKKKFNVKDISEAAKLPTARVASHLVYLVKKEIAEKVDRGEYRLVD